MTAEDQPNKPLVTVITPAYNQAAYLAETIDSVLMQDYPNFEYIVIDDGSTDHTRQVLEAYDDPRLTWLSHSNRGEAATVNIGFEMAHGDYIFIISADDPILPGLFKTAVEFMEQRPELLVAYPRWQEIDPKSNVLYEFPTYEYSYTKMLTSFNCLPNTGTIIRRRAIELVGGRNPNLRWALDIDFWMRIGLHGPMARIPELLASHRIHPASKTQTEKGVAMMQEYIKVVSDYYSLPDLPAEALAVRREAFSNIYNMAAQYVLAHDWGLARKYFIQSLLYCPFCRLPQPDGRATRSWLLILRVVLLPRAVNKFIKRIWVMIRRNN